jgi:hypothetical protein
LARACYDPDANITMLQVVWRPWQAGKHVQQRPAVLRRERALPRRPLTLSVRARPPVPSLLPRFAAATRRSCRRLSARLVLLPRSQSCCPHTR